MCIYTGCWILNIYYYYILSVYSLLPDSVGLPLHKIISPFLLCRSQVLPCPLLHSLTMSFLVAHRSSAFNSKFHTFLLPVLFIFLHHMSIPLLMTVVIGSTPTNFLNSSLVLLSFIETPHIHIILCISALSKFKPTSAS